MLEAIIIIVSLGGLELALWWADHKRQAEQLATLEAIWVELALLNEERAPRSPAQVSQLGSAHPVDLPISVAQNPTVVAQ